MTPLKDKNKFMDVDTILFDMDGVITSEGEYWNTADLTILELFYSNQFVGLVNENLQTILFKPGSPIKLDRFVSNNFIALLKNNGLNTNWDLTYFASALYLIELFSRAQPRDKAKAIAEFEFNTGTLRELGKLIPDKKRILEPIDSLSAYFLQFIKKRGRNISSQSVSSPEKRALDFIEDINLWRYERTGFKGPVFDRSGAFWDICERLFQERYLGDILFLRDHDSTLSEIPKDGMIEYEEPVIPLQKIVSTLAMLKEARINFGIATGRPYDEIMIPLIRWGLYHFFDEDNISTHRDILEAEEFLKSKGQNISLAKPHPYVYLRALYGKSKSIPELLEMSLPLPEAKCERVIIVGDSVSDIMAARCIGVKAVVVLTGVKSLEAVEMMKAFSPEFLLNDISEFEDLL